MSEEKTFESLLKTKDQRLFACLQNIRERAQEDWIHLLVPDMGSHAGYIHLRNVERTADKLVPARAKEEFSPGELFLLLAAILLHDVGRIIPKEAPAEGPGAMRCPGEAWNHWCGSKRLIDEQWGIFGLPDNHIAGYCGLLAYAHGMGGPLQKGTSCLCSPECVLTGLNEEAFRETSLEPYGRLRIPLLAAILRIADEAENHWTRAIRDSYYQIYLQSGQGLGKAFRRCIEDVEFRHDDHCIIMHLPQIAASEPALKASLLRSLVNIGETVQKVVQAWSRPLKCIDVHFDHVFFERGGLWYADHFGAFDDFPKPGSLFSMEELPAAEEILNALLRLSLGTLKYDKGFTLQELEAESGRRFTDDQDRPLLSRLANAGCGIELRHDSVYVSDPKPLQRFREKLQNDIFAGLSSEQKRMLRLIVEDLRDHHPVIRDCAPSRLVPKSSYTRRTLTLIARTCQVWAALREALRDKGKQFSFRFDALQQLLTRWPDGVEDGALAELSCEQEYKVRRIVEALNDSAPKRIYTQAALSLIAFQCERPNRFIWEKGDIFCFNSRNLESLLREWPEKEEEQEQELDGAIRTMAQGTLRYPYISWDALEGELGRALDEVDRRILARMADGYETFGFRIGRGRKAGELKIEYESELRESAAALERKRLRGMIYKQPTEQDNPEQAFLGLFKGTLEYTRTTWGVIEAEVGKPISLDQRHSILSSGITDSEITLTVEESRSGDLLRITRTKTGAAGDR